MQAQNESNTAQCPDKVWLGHWEIYAAGSQFHGRKGTRLVSAPDELSARWNIRKEVSFEFCRSDFLIEYVSIYSIHED